MVNSRAKGAAGERELANRMMEQTRNLNDVSDADLMSGVTGVFTAKWNKFMNPPPHTGHYIVVVRSYEPVVALYIKGNGWYLDRTDHIGLEDHIQYWMALPEAPKDGIL
jgi:hypothetical protein